MSSSYPILKHKILPATRSDIPKLVAVYIAAESSNVLTFSMHQDQHEWAKETTELIEKEFDNPEYMFMKVLDGETGEIGGLGFWNMGSPRSGRVQSSSAEHGVFGGGQVLAVTEEKELTPLQKYLQAKMQGFAKSWMVETRNLYLGLLMTDPKYQRRGIGTAMLNWGHERADKEKVPMFLIATPVGHGLYQHVGWKDIAEPIEVDLREWVEGGKGGDQGWGDYRFYPMLRLPKTG